MSKVYVVMGYSNAGKDTVYQIMQKALHYSTVNIKFAAPMKAILEFHYDLPVGFLENRQKRQELVPGHPDEITWGELMIRCFRCFPRIDQTMMVRKVQRQVEAYIRQGYCPIFTDVRNYSECFFIRDMAARGRRIIPIWIERPGTVPKTSDLHQDRIFEYLKQSHGSYHIVNDSGIPELTAKVKEVIRDGY